MRLLDNLIDGSRRSITYESRLYKYALRGFGVAVPGYEPEYLDVERILEETVYDTKGFPRLLVYDNNWKPVNLEKQAYTYHQKIINSAASAMALEQKEDSDYSWIPAWGVLTLAKLNEFHAKVFKWQFSYLFCAETNNF